MLPLNLDAQRIHAFDPPYAMRIDLWILTEHPVSAAHLFYRLARNLRMYFTPLCQVLTTR